MTVMETGRRNVITLLQTEAHKLPEYDLDVARDGVDASLAKLSPMLDDVPTLADVFGRENLTVAHLLISNARFIADGR